MKRFLLLIMLCVPTAAFAQFNDHDGQLVSRWHAPAFGAPVDHYIWSYTINGVADSIAGIAAANDTLNNAVSLSVIGNWAIFNIAAVSIFGDTSEAAVSDTAYYNPESGIGPPEGVTWLQGP